MTQYKKEYIIIHHSATSDTVTSSWEAIRKYHIETNGWRDIGYHYGVELVGNKYEVRKGRDELDSGAHCKESNMNFRGLGICLVGNFDEKEPPLKQLHTAAKLCAGLCRKHNIPVSHIDPHNKYAINSWTGKPYKSCPGNKFSMTTFRGMVKAELEGGGYVVADDIRLIIKGKEMQPDVPPVLVKTTGGDRLMVPLRFVAEVLGARVHYDDKTKIVTID